MAHRILAVDDEVGIAKLIKANLDRAGYTTEIAHNGADALRMLLSAQYDLLITDVMMPEMDGFELVQSVRDDPHLANLPVILLTAKSTDTDITTGYMSGTDLYLTKPFSPAELLSWVERLLITTEE
jgi:DNA-binding response OmpR family regulator